MKVKYNNNDSEHSKNLRIRKLELEWKMCYDHSGRRSGSYCTYISFTAIYCRLFPMQDEVKCSAPSQTRVHNRSCPDVRQTPRTRCMIEMLSYGQTWYTCLSFFFLFPNKNIQIHFHYYLSKNIFS